jgi:energy-coupling factor transport system ATP-binding protein
MKPIVEVRGLKHVYSAGTPFEQQALKGIDFEIQQGELIAVIGHTGSGKSTLIQHLNGLLRPTSGQVLFHGTDIFARGTDLRAIRARIGLVFQYPEYQLFEETVEKDIAYGAVNQKLPQDEVKQRVIQALQAVGLPNELLEKSPFELSGGQKRRVALAGVLAMQPEVLILDEPTAGLDPVAREEMFALISQLHQAGTTIVLVTHSMEDAARIASRLLVMRSGKILLNGTPAEVFAHAEELEQSGLTVPQVTKILLELRRRGIPIDTSCYTIEQAVQALLSCKNGGVPC